MWLQTDIRLKSRRRGFHLITEEILQKVPQIADIGVGIAHFFIQHSSASLTINENADAAVRRDMESHFNHFVPENQAYYLHNDEGSDDMPAHIKASLLGSSVSIPIHQGALRLGIWQGIYLGEHRNHAGARILVVTINGE